jgi:hypothetical protein
LFNPRSFGECRLKGKLMKISHPRMSRYVAASVGVGLLVGSGISTNSFAQIREDQVASNSSPPKYASGTIFDPPSSLLFEREIGKKAHTNLKILVPPVNAARDMTA